MLEHFSNRINKSYWKCSGTINTDLDANRFRESSEELLPFPQNFLFVCFIQFHVNLIILHLTFSMKCLCCLQTL